MNWGAPDISASPPSWLTSDSNAAPNEQSAQGGSEDVPDFIREAGWREVETGREGIADQAGTEEESRSAALPGDLPAWVRALAPTDESEPASPERTPAGQSPGWASEAASTASGPSTGAEALGESDPSADWLKDLAPMTEDVGEAGLLGDDAMSREESVPTSDVGIRGKPQTEQDDALAWLEGLAEKHGAKPEELITSPGQRPSSPPEWVERARDFGEEAPEGWLPISEAAEPVGRTQRRSRSPKPVDGMTSRLTGLPACRTRIRSRKPRDSPRSRRPPSLISAGLAAIRSLDEGIPVAKHRNGSCPAKSSQVLPSQPSHGRPRASMNLRLICPSGWQDWTLNNLPDPRMHFKGRSPRTCQSGSRPRAQPDKSRMVAEREQDRKPMPWMQRRMLQPFPAAPSHPSQSRNPNPPIRRHCPYRFQQGPGPR
jgi:hypothetical protein